MLLWTFCVFWWKTNGAGCVQRTYRKPSGCSLGPLLRGRTVLSRTISIKFETYVHAYTFIWNIYLFQKRIFCFRWLEVGVAHLTSAPCWVIYLQVLQEAVWPGGTLPVQPRPERSAAQRQEAKEQCLDCLMQLLPGPSLLLVWPFNPVRFCFCNLSLSFSPFHSFFPAWAEIITDMLGSEKFRLSIETMLESLQDPQINKWVCCWKIKPQQTNFTSLN